jgi:hypothetical protein
MGKATSELGWRVVYLDANNCKYPPYRFLSLPSSVLSVYGSAMMFLMPVGDFHFLEDDSEDSVKLQHFFHLMEDSHLRGGNVPIWNKHFPNEEEGYYLECDVSYPEDRHESLADFPPCPAKTSIKEENLSTHFKEMWYLRNGVGRIPDSEKLIASLVSKESIVIHSENAGKTVYYHIYPIPSPPSALYARLGCKIIIKRILKFRQARVLAPWVEHATEGRRRAASKGDDLLVNVFKLCVSLPSFF